MRVLIWLVTRKDDCLERVLTKYFCIKKLIDNFPSFVELFSCVCIAWYKHEMGWENSRQFASPRLRLGFAKLSKILPTPLAFISGYANTQNVFYRSFSLSHNKKSKSRTIQWKKLRNCDVIEDKINKTLYEGLGLCFSPNFRYSSKCLRNLQRSRSQFFTIRTSQPANNIHIFFNKFDRSLVSRTSITRKFKMLGFPNEARYWVVKL